MAVHSLVCTAFHGPRPSPKHQVAHKDGDKTNNAAVNLRWATAKENIADKILHGTMAHSEANGRAKLTIEQVREIRRRMAEGETQKGLAQAYGVAASNISHIATGKNWSYVK